MPTRRIIFSRIALDASIGILEHERIATQPIHIDAEIEVDVNQPVNDTDINSVLDYRTLHESIVKECTSGHVNLLETLTDNVANRLLTTFIETREVTVRITKPSAFADSAGVAIEVHKQRSS
ncbi:dihydroneopterin aldolase [Orrella daihaiensis]|uniref:dihydroneopterin aldolase n=1 Tax=Orrella daihaiensis TaxID=2782176 RepID=A0ABY4AIY1_9BURK|nr:dihydroneopterin aldolase [Orrella daihaiensis]UOD50250.1 dihydroneopterin aldolase [Orrella daihaiensis]